MFLFETTYVAYFGGILIAEESEKLSLYELSFIESHLFFLLARRKPSDHVGPRRTIELSAKEENYKNDKKKEEKKKNKNKKRLKFEGITHQSRK